jgi:hypothetical protein
VGKAVPDFAEFIIVPAHRVRPEPAIGPAKGRTLRLHPGFAPSPASWARAARSLFIGTIELEEMMDRQALVAPLFAHRDEPRPVLAFGQAMRRKPR